jgi:hypothetical protein
MQFGLWRGLNFVQGRYRRGGVRIIELPDKAIPTAGNRLDIARAIRGIIQRTAQAVHGCVEPVIKVHERVCGPDSLLQFLATYNFSWPFEERLQNLQRLLLQAN